MKQFGVGVRMLVTGFSWWSRRPARMAWGLVPAFVVGVLFVAAFTTLVAFLPALTTTLTPFASGWPELWATLTRIAVGTALVGAAGLLATLSFTALVLVVGEPVYDRLWREVERELTGTVPDAGYGWRASIADALVLVGRGIGVAVVAALLGLVPFVGSVLAFTTGVLLSGWVLADELSSRALTARGIDRRARRALLRGHRARTLGFGVATQLCFLVPLGAVVVMPAAVAGATSFARSLLGETVSAGEGGRPASPTTPTR